MASNIPTSPIAGEQSRTAFIYVIGGPPGAVKIGFAVDPRRRCLAMQTGNPHTLQVAYQLPVVENDAPAIERHAHWLLREKLLKGEWFGVTVAAAASAIRKAAKAVQEGSAGEERHGKDDRVKVRLDDVLADLFVDGELDEDLYQAARAYRRGLGWSMTDTRRNIHEHRHDHERILDAKRWIDRTSKDIRQRLGAEALLVLQAVILRGDRLRSQPLARMRGPRAERLLRQALSIVAEHVPTGPWALP